MRTLPITLKPSRTKWVLLLVGSSAFVAIGVWLLPRQPLIAYSSIAFFGLCAIAAALNLHPASSYLLLTTEGFTFASLFRKHFVPWGQVEAFSAVTIMFNRMVGWNYTKEFWEHQSLRKINTAISGAEAALPDTYGMSASELAQLMEELRVKNRPALRAEPSSG